MQVDVLELKVGKVIYKDYSKGAQPAVQEFNLNLNERFTDINDPNKLVGVIVAKALANTTIARLANFDLKALEGTLGDTLATAQKLAGSAQEVISSSSGTVAQVAQKAEETAKETTKAAQDRPVRACSPPRSGQSRTARNRAHPPPVVCPPRGPLGRDRCRPAPAPRPGPHCALNAGPRSAPETGRASRPPESATAAHCRRRARPDRRRSRPRPRPPSRRAGGCGADC